MIWNLCAKWYFLEDLIKIYHLEIWTYLGSILLKACSFNTLVFQISLFDKIVYQNWSILCDSLLNMCFCVHNIPYAICLCGNHNIPHLARECLVLVHLGPLHKESVYEHLLAVQSSGLDIYVHDFVQWSNYLHIWYQMKFIWCKIAFWKLIFKFIFYMFYKCIFLEVGKFFNTLFMNL